MADEQFSATLVAIDDDPAALELIRETLAGNGLEILTEGNAELGLELVLRKRPQIVLLAHVCAFLRLIADRLVENSEIFLLGGPSLRKPQTSNPPAEKE